VNDHLAIRNLVEARGELAEWNVDSIGNVAFTVLGATSYIENIFAAVLRDAACGSSG
jgi:hypothetical protein